MIKVIDIRLNTNEIDNQKLILKNISEKLNINQDRINNLILSKKSIDSRNKKIKYQFKNYSLNRTKCKIQQHFFLVAG